MSRTQISKQVDNRLRTGNAVIAAGRNHAEIIAAAAAERCSRAGVPVPDARAFVQAVTAVLEASGTTLRDSELRLTLELSDDVDTRIERDTATAEVVAQVVDVRRLVESYGGPGALAKFGLSGSTPRDPKSVEGHALNLVSLMKTRDQAVVVPGVGETTTSRLAEQLEGPLARLQAANRAVEDEQRQNEQALRERDRALADWTEAYQGTASILEGLLRFAGEQALAERVRPTHRKTMGQEAPAEETAEVATPATPVEPEPV